jgi:hypothetical protein
VEHTGSEKESSLESTVGVSTFGAKDTIVDSDASVEEKETYNAWVDLNNEQV